MNESMNNYFLIIFFSSFLGFSSFLACGYPCEGEVWHPSGGHQVSFYKKK